MLHSNSGIGQKKMKNSHGVRGSWIWAQLVANLYFLSDHEGETRHGKRPEQSSVFVRVCLWSECSGVETAYSNLDQIVIEGGFTLEFPLSHSFWRDGCAPKLRKVLWLRFVPVCCLLLWLRFSEVCSATSLYTFWRKLNFESSTQVSKYLKWKISLPQIWHQLDTCGMQILDSCMLLGLIFVSGEIWKFD